MEYSVGINFAIIGKPTQTNCLAQLTPPCYLKSTLGNVETLFISIKHILLLYNTKYEKTIWATYDKLNAKQFLHQIN